VTVVAEYQPYVNSSYLIWRWNGGCRRIAIFSDSVYLVCVVRISRRRGQAASTPAWSHSEHVLASFSRKCRKLTSTRKSVTLESAGGTDATKPILDAEDFQTRRPYVSRARRHYARDDSNRVEILMRDACYFIHVWIRGISASVASIYDCGDL